ncbi:MFS transporter [Catenibacillus scindens]|uniref:MFS transporter n=1 Tax=Catenibacillus scindens TaxID=673271 RepID=UPI003209089B
MKILNRWVYAIVGVIVLLLAGLVYAWSVLAAPIANEFTSWSQAQLSLTFTICMTLFCIGGLVGGIVSNKISVKINVWISALLFVVGFVIASQTTSLAGLYIGYGILAGFASGLVYNAIMSSVSKWFPDKQGLISGILLMGFGFGSFFVGKIYTAVVPSLANGWRTAFMGMGIILVVVIGICGFFVAKPGSDFKPPAGAVKAAKKRPDEGIDVGPSVMLKRPAFWLYFIWAILLSAAGLALIAQATGVANEINAAVVAKGGSAVSDNNIATIVGLISIFNGIGRVIFGGMYDKFGRGKTMFAINAAFFISVLIVIAAILTGSMPILIVGFICCGLSYGGVTPTNSAFANSFYGPTHYPVNFPIINLNLILASFGGTIAGALYDASQSYLSTFIVLLVAIVIGTVCSFLIKKP